MRSTRQDATLGRLLAGALGGTEQHEDHPLLRLLSIIDCWALLEDGNIMTPGQANDNGVLCAFGGIVFFELRAQPPRLTTHNGIDLGIVNRLSTEDKHPDGCLFEVLGFALQRRLHDERKQSHEL